MYKRLAASICPSTPFLVPKRACQSIHHGPYKLATVIAVPLRCYSDRTRDIKKKRRREHGIASAEVRQKEEHALARQRPPPEAIAQRAQQLHHDLRTRGRSQQALQAIYKEAEKLADDIMKGGLPSSAASSRHLLGIFKESKHYTKGDQFWNWLKDREDGSVDQTVYSVAIELLAYKGATLETIEELRKQALNRWPGTFAEYHISPSGVVPDRRLQLPRLHGLPMSLLSSVITARSILGDWTGAYIGFDTSLRLMPDRTLKSIYTRLISERSVPEGLILYLMACRARTEVHGATVSTLLKNIFSQTRDKISSERFDASFDTLAIMIEVVRLRIAAGLTVAPEHISMVVKGFSKVSIPYPTHEERNPDNLLIYTHNDMVLRSAQQFVETLVSQKALVSPSSSIYAALLALAAGTSNKECVAMCKNKLQELNAFGDVHVQIALLSAASYASDLAGMQDHWQEIARLSHGKPSSKEWRILTLCLRHFEARSTDYAELLKFIEVQIDLFASDDGLKAYVKTEIAKESKRRNVVTQNTQLMLADVEFKALADRITVSLGEVLNAEKSDEMIESFLRTSIIRPTEALDTENLTSAHTPVTDTEDEATFSSTSMPSPTTAPTYEAALKQVYDSLTTDPSFPEDPLVEPAIDSAGIRYDVHRYENWKDVNRLLYIANILETKKMRAVGLAIKNGQPVESELNIEKDVLFGLRGWDGRVGERLGLQEQILKLRGMM